MRKRESIIQLIITIAMTAFAIDILYLYDGVWIESITWIRAFEFSLLWLAVIGGFVNIFRLVRLI